MVSLSRFLRQYCEDWHIATYAAGAEGRACPGDIGWQSGICISVPCTIQDLILEVRENQTGKTMRLFAGEGVPRFRVVLIPSAHWRTALRRTPPSTVFGHPRIS